MPMFAIQAYIRDHGELIETVLLCVEAETRWDAQDKVVEHYAMRGLDAGINADSVRRMVNFYSLERDYA